MSVAAIISLLLTLLSTIWFVYTEIWDVDGAKECLALITGCFIILTLFLSIYDGKPTAMDVYQGKTELEYTVRGDTVIDSTVVFKPDVEKIP